MSARIPSPRHARRLKKKLLRQVVAENLTAMGIAPPPIKRRARRIRWIALGGTALAVAVLLVGIINPTSAGRGKAPGEEALPEAAAPELETPGEPEGAPGKLAAPHAMKPALLSLAVRKIVIDPGHGGSDPGASTAGGLSEKEITLDVGRRLKVLLEAVGLEVLLTRQGDETLSLRQRSELANAAKGDVFLSIHVNSIPVAERRGIETYYLGQAEDPRVERLAGAENSDSGYSMADFRRLLEGILVDVRHEQSRRFAATLQGTLYAALQHENPSLQDRGVKRAPFVVLVGTDMPGALVEVSCVSNQEEAKLLLDEGYRQEIAQGLSAGVRAWVQQQRAAARVARRRGGG